jgi:hypothetical protein
MTNDFSELRVADGSITKLCVVDGDVQAHLQNWREQRETITFHDVVGLEAFGFLNTALSHVTESANDPLLVRSCSMGGEPANDFRCYAFYSAWADQPVLKVVARSWSVGGE